MSQGRKSRYFDIEQINPGICSWNESCHNCAALKDLFSFTLDMTSVQVIFKR